MKQINVLAVDDDKDVLKTLCSILTALKLHPIAAADGVEALEKIKTQNVDLILTDLLMPNMDGFGLIKESRKLNANIPIAVISGHGGVKNVTDALSLGAYNVITKPFTIRGIENIVIKGIRLREFSLGNLMITEGIRHYSEMEIPSYQHLLPPTAHYIVKECKWRGIDDAPLLNNISTSIDELLNNALIHGNNHSETKKILIKFNFDHEKFILSVQDEGQGFDYKSIVSEFAGNAQILPEKRGLFIVNYLMDELSFNEQGNMVTMVKYTTQ